MKCLSFKYVIVYCLVNALFSQLIAGPTVARPALSSGLPAQQTKLSPRITLRAADVHTIFQSAKTPRAPLSPAPNSPPSSLPAIHVQDPRMAKVIEIVDRIASHLSELEISDDHVYNALSFIRQPGQPEIVKNIAIYNYVLDHLESSYAPTDKLEALSPGISRSLEEFDDDSKFERQANRRWYFIRTSWIPALIIAWLLEFVPEKIDNYILTSLISGIRYVSLAYGLLGALRNFLWFFVDDVFCETSPEAEKAGLTKSLQDRQIKKLFAPLKKILIEEITRDRPEYQNTIKKEGLSGLTYVFAGIRSFFSYDKDGSDYVISHQPFWGKKQDLRVEYGTTSQNNPLWDIYIYQDGFGNNCRIPLKIKWADGSLSLSVEPLFKAEQFARVPSPNDPVRRMDYDPVSRTLTVVLDLTEAQQASLQDQGFNLFAGASPRNGFKYRILFEDTSSNPAPNSAEVSEVPHKKSLPAMRDPSFVARPEIHTKIMPDPLPIATAI